MTDLLDYIRTSVIGNNEVVPGPFGPRRVIYADYTASGRSLAFVEDYIRESVLPLYANTHTESSGTGLQTTRLREEARSTIRRCVGANRDHAVLFCGSGMTGAVDKLLGILGLRVPHELDRHYRLTDRIPLDERPVVFIGPFEHHSNELPWRESIADVVRIDEDADGHVDLDLLQARLVEYAERPLKIGSFSAASNVTGIITDAAAVSSLLHDHGALSFWDFAAAAPYVEISMAAPPEGPANAYKDAVLLSPHKLIGGPGTPGVLVARRELFANAVPDVPGGGTVAYVNRTEHRYVEDIEHREEGGTPAIIESIRAGLVFQLKEAVGVDAIREREEEFIRRAVASWQTNPNIEILGNPDAERLSIVSMVFRHQERYLHYNFIVALLNDLFGIQSRGGCSCAGPYGHGLLGIDDQLSAELDVEVAKGCEGIKPGWVRVNFNYFISEAVFDYILEAVHLVALEGWKLLPFYEFDPATGLWVHRDAEHRVALRLEDIDYSSGTMAYEHDRTRAPDSSLAGYLDESRKILNTAQDDLPEPLGTPKVTSGFEELRWFPLPDELRIG